MEKASWILHSLRAGEDLEICCLFEKCSISVHTYSRKYHHGSLCTAYHYQREVGSNSVTANDSSDGTILEGFWSLGHLV